MFCSKCGNVMEEGELFCGKCSAPVSQLKKKEDVTQRKDKLITFIFLGVAFFIFGLIGMRNNLLLAASTMRLTDYDGEVLYTEKSGVIHEVKPDMRLIAGYKLTTEKESKAWVLLDEERFVTVMERSTVRFDHSGKNMKLSLEEGDLFFNISRELESDESFEISVSTMVIGIRGTSGYVSADEDGYPVLYLTSGKVNVDASDPDSGNEDECKVKAGQKLTVIIEDGEIIFRIEDISEYDLPADAVIEICGDDNLLDEVCEDTGWDKDILLELKDQNENEEENPEESADTDDTVTVTDLAGLWELDTELSSDPHITGVGLRLYDDLTGQCEYIWDNDFHYFEFTWTLSSSGAIQIYSEKNELDSNMIYTDGMLEWGSGVYLYREFGLSGSPGIDVEDVVGKYKLTSGTLPITYIQFNSDMYGFYESENYSTGAKVIVTFRWEIDESISGCVNMYTDSPTDTYQIYTIGSVFVGDNSINFTVAEDVSVVYLRMTMTDDYDIPTLEVADFPDVPVNWTYDDYLYYSAWNGEYTDSSTGNTLELFIGAPATGAGSACGRMAIYDSMTFLSYYGEGCFRANYSEGDIGIRLLEDSIKLEYPIGSGTYYYFTK